MEFRPPEQSRSFCHLERSEGFILNGVKDLRYNYVHEMCPPDSSLTLRMTGRDIQKNIKDKRKSIIIW